MQLSISIHPKHPSGAILVAHLDASPLLDAPSSHGFQLFSCEQLQMAVGGFGAVGLVGNGEDEAAGSELQEGGEDAVHVGFGEVFEDVQGGDGIERWKAGGAFGEQVGLLEANLGEMAFPGQGARRRKWSIIDVDTEYMRELGHSFGSDQGQEAGGAAGVEQARAGAELADTTVKRGEDLARVVVTRARYVVVEALMVALQSVGGVEMPGTLIIMGKKRADDGSENVTVGACILHNAERFQLLHHIMAQVAVDSFRREPVNQYFLHHRLPLHLRLAW